MSFDNKITQKNNFAATLQVSQYPKGDVNAFL